MKNTKKLTSDSFRKLASQVKTVFALEWKYARAIFFWNLVDQVFNVIEAVAIPFLTKELVELAINGNAADGRRLVILTLTVLLLRVSHIIIYTGVSVYRGDYIFIKDAKFKEDLCEKALRIAPECLETPELYDCYSRVTSFGLEQINGMFWSIVHMLSRVATIAAASAIMIAYNLWIALAFIAAYIPLFFVKAALQKKLYQFKIDNTANERKKDVLFDFIHDRAAVAELKLFGAFPFVIRRRNEITKSLRDDFVKLNAEHEIKTTFVGILPDIAYYAVYAAYAVFVTAGRITYGDLTFLLSTMGNYSSCVGGIGSFFVAQAQNFTLVDQLTRFLNLPEERSGLPEHRKQFSSIQLKNVSFAYPSTEESPKEVLKNVNLIIRRSEKIAIVGANGSGKTTTVKMILGLFDSYQGKILINGADARQMNHRDIYGNFSTAMQNYQKYPFSLRENIEIADCANPSTERFERAVKLSGANEIAEKVSTDATSGYDVTLSKEYDLTGTDLSEGQWHKLILARALYQSRDVVIFDEPTASLDPKAEAGFVRDVTEKLSDKTLVMVTHRLGSVKSFDRIVVFDGGQIIGEGTHEKLMQTCAVYRNMFDTQASRYEM